MTCTFDCAYRFAIDKPGYVSRWSTLAKSAIPLSPVARSGLFQRRILYQIQGFVFDIL
jgi:hypothetical protein